ncbi:HIT domain-containing protein [Candidatus Babeliales bacterium]|nr:HIT domain-containing protein [Candidatus Babeliales bacterium]MBP9843669.1 HIT domain-containing protein [Candidatus Babeliales bacterium]
MHDQNCIFCKIISGVIPSKFIYETDLSIVLQDIAPRAPIHYLIIPKKHVQDLSACTLEDAALLADMMLIPARLSAQIDDQTAFKLIANNGYAAGQRVFHLHFHFMAGRFFQEEV